MVLSQEDGIRELSQQTPSQNGGPLTRSEAKRQLGVLTTPSKSLAAKNPLKEKKGMVSDRSVNSLHRFLQIGKKPGTIADGHATDGKTDTKLDQSPSDVEEVDDPQLSQSAETQRSSLDDLDVMWLVNRDQNNNISKDKKLHDEIRQAMEKLEERLVAKVTRQLDDWATRLEETMLTMQGQLVELQSRQQEELMPCQKCLANSQAQTEKDAGGTPGDVRGKRKDTSARKSKKKKATRQGGTHETERWRLSDSPGEHTQASSQQFPRAAASNPRDNLSSPPGSQENGTRPRGGGRAVWMRGDSQQGSGTWQRGAHGEMSQETLHTHPRGRKGQDKSGRKPKAPSKIPNQEVEGELQARALRKRNLIVRGWTDLRADMDKDALQHEVCDILFQVTGIAPSVERLIVVEKQIVLQLRSLGNKIRILRRRRNLRNLFGYNLWLDDDLTAREVEVQKWLQEEAERLGRLGAKAKVGYVKLIVDGVCWQWDESEANFICLPPKQPFRRGY